MSAVNDETKAAIKLTRADAVKLVASEMMIASAGDVSMCRDAVDYSQTRFYSYIVACGRSEFAPALSTLVSVSAAVERMHAICTYRVYTDGSDSGSTAQVIFSDHQQTYEAAIRITVSVELDETAFGLRYDWLKALNLLQDARERDTRVGAMKKEAREVLIKSALDSSDEGAVVVKAIRALAKSLKDKS